MKKIMSLVMVAVMILSFSGVVLATTEVPVATTTISASPEEGTTTESTQLTEEQIAELLAAQSGSTDTSASTKEDTSYIVAKVVSVEAVGSEEIDTMYGKSTLKTQEIEVKLLTGDNKGKTLTAKHWITLDYQGKFEAKPLKAGQTVYVDVQTNDTDKTFDINVIQVKRDFTLLIGAIVVAIAIIALARFKGIETVGLLLLNTAIISGSMILLYMRGINSYVGLVGTVGLIIVTNILIINKINKQSMIAICGAIMATAISLGALILFTNLTGLIGLVEYASFLQNAPSEVNFKYMDIILVTTLISSLGAVIDMALRTTRKYDTKKGILANFETISKKLPNKLNNTFLAWAGMVAAIFLVFMVFERPLLEVVNVETISTEIVKILVILFNVALVIPITSLLTRELLKEEKNVVETEVKK